MKAALNMGSARRVLCLTALAAIGFAILLAPGKWASSAAPRAEAPACSSCDARHARLVQLRAAMSGVSE